MDNGAIKSNVFIKNWEDYGMKCKMWLSLDQYNFDCLFLPILYNFTIYIIYIYSTGKQKT